MRIFLSLLVAMTFAVTSASHAQLETEGRKAVDGKGIAITETVEGAYKVTVRDMDRLSALLGIANYFSINLKAPNDLSEERIVKETYRGNIEYIISRLLNRYNYIITYNDNELSSNISQIAIFKNANIKESSKSRNTKSSYLRDSQSKKLLFNDDKVGANDKAINWREKLSQLRRK